VGAIKAGKGEVMLTMTKESISPFSGFYKLSQQQRYQKLLQHGVLTPEEVLLLQNTVSPQMNELADGFIENAIGCFSLPLGVVPQMIIDGQAKIIPMAVEETSIIAALSNTAKWVASHGELMTESVGNANLGQIYFPKITDMVSFISKIQAQKQGLIACVNQDVAKGLAERGGGVVDLEVRTLLEKPGALKAVVHVLVDTCDAMGANIINQACEYLKKPLEALTGEQASMCIVSNLADQKLTRARVVIHDIDEKHGEAIEEASHFAELDPYRAATSNKGVMNGMDAVLIATGNDWRAVEAGVHAYAARSGQYRSITRWRMYEGDLVGELEAPIITGCVGGVTKLHPVAQMALNMLEVNTAKELSRVVGAVGLMQNLGAIRALIGDGIVKGHMRLHIKNLIIAVGAQPNEADELQTLLERRLVTKNKVSLSDAKELLSELR
jgi:hydroxymethylglutaryl-CoA reductase